VSRHAIETVLIKRAECIKRPCTNCEPFFPRDRNEKASLRTRETDAHKRAVGKQRPDDMSEPF